MKETIFLKGEGKMLFKQNTKIDKRTNLEKEIDEILRLMTISDRTSEDYELYLDRLEVLYKLKNGDVKKVVSPDTLAIIAGNLLGIGMILSYERCHVITSKAIGFVIKGRA